MTYKLTERRDHVEVRYQLKNNAERPFAVLDVQPVFRGWPRAEPHPRKPHKYVKDWVHVQVVLAERKLVLARRIPPPFPVFGHGEPFPPMARKLEPGSTLDDGFTLNKPVMENAGWTEWERRPDVWHSKYGEDANVRERVSVVEVQIDYTEVPRENATEVTAEGAPLWSFDDFWGRVERPKISTVSANIKLGQPWDVLVLPRERPASWPKP